MISKSQISYIKSLHQKKYRREHQQFIIEGDKLLREFVHSAYELEAIYVIPEYYEECLEYISKVSKKLEIEVIKQEEMARISTLATASECLALVNFRNVDQAQHIDPKLFQEELVLMLDGVRDPGNLGTIIRIADWFGIKHIICSEDCVELYNPKVIQSTMGSILRVSIHYADVLALLKSVKGINIWGAVLDGENIYEVNATEKNNGILLMGSESHGIHEQLLNFINRPITIPNFGKGAESLNVAVATGILCSEFIARR